MDLELVQPDRKYAAARILVVDNEATNVRTLTRILKAAGYTNVVSTTDPTKVVALFAEQEPDLLLLDLHMPVLDGVAVLERLAELAAPHSYLPVLVLTGDASQQARRRALTKGAKDFVTKPFEVDEVLLRIRNLLETKFLHREIAAENVELEHRVAERTAELESAHLDSLERLAVAAEYRDDDTGRHTERVAALATILGRASGLADEEVELLRRAAPLHDLGKIGIPDAILRKPGPLTPGEWEIMKTHTTAGARILVGGKSRVIRQAEEIALSHHERWDGSGYPEARAEDAIPLSARVVAVADVFDALTSERVYRKAWTPAAVQDYLRSHSGVHFDPHLVAVSMQPLVWQAFLAVRDR